MINNVIFSRSVQFLRRVQCNRVLCFKCVNVENSIKIIDSYSVKLIRNVK